MTYQNPWLITGGAGYIGAHIAYKFLQNGLDIIIYDSLYSGIKSRVDFLSHKYGSKIQFVQADIREVKKFAECLLEFNPVGIIHTAALKSVEESIKNPSEYLDINFEATREILNLSKQRNIEKFIFSSTAAVYGSPATDKAIKEDDLKNPISPYGISKLMAENEVERYGDGEGRVGISLRFFNVVGTAALELQDNSTDNLVPIVMSNLKSGKLPTIFGTDYPTTDGTCIRDYIDVRDVARLHFETANSRLKLPQVLNVGTGHGASVREVIRLVGASAGTAEVSTNTANRRVGDPPSLYADTSLLKSTIAFMAEHSLEESIKSLLYSKHNEHI